MQKYVSNASEARSEWHSNKIEMFIRYSIGDIPPVVLLHSFTFMFMLMHNSEHQMMLAGSVHCSIFISSVCLFESAICGAHCERDNNDMLINGSIRNNQPNGNGLYSMWQTTWSN